MKKIFVLLLALLLVFSFAACGTDEPADDPVQQEQQQPDEQPENEGSEEAGQQGPRRTGLRAAAGHPGPTH